MVMGTVQELTARSPFIPAAPLSPIECIALIGVTSAVGGNVPAIGTMTLITHKGAGTDGAEQFGVYADGSIPAALEAIYDEVTNMNVVVIRAVDATETELLAAFDMVEMIEADPDINLKPTRITTAEDTWDVTGGAIDNSGANSLVTRMEQVAEALRIYAYANGTDGTQAEFIAWGGVNPSARVAGVWPQVRLPGQATDLNAGPIVAAIAAREARGRGYWANVNGSDSHSINRLKSPVRFDMFDSTAASQVIAVQNNLVTFVRLNRGWHLWGNKFMQAASSTDRKRYMSRRQVFDQMYRYLQTAVFIAIQAQVGPAFFDAVTAYVKERIDALIAREAIDSGDCYPDRALNTPSALEDGDVSFVTEIDGVSDVRTVNFKLLEL